MKLVSNLDILANIFDSKCLTDNKYLTDSSSSYVIWWLKTSLLFIIRPISTGVLTEKDMEDPAV